MPIGNRQSKIGNLYSVAGGPPSGPAAGEFFAEPMGKGTRRGRGRARQGRPGASRAYPAAPFRAEDTPPSGTASNFNAVTLWIIYQEVKGGMHCDLTKSDLDEALGGELVSRQHERSAKAWGKRMRGVAAGSSRHTPRKFRRRRVLAAPPEALSSFEPGDRGRRQTATAVAGFAA